jgi:transmembrane sensor
MTVSGDGGSQIALAGAAYFDIRHDPRRALAITAGPLTVTDIGTRFEIRQHPGDVVVEVAEGRVSAQATAMAAPMPLVAGKRLDFDMAAGRATVSTVAPQEVAAWRDGRLSYTSAPLELVARDLARYAGVRVEVPRALARRQFSGSLFISDGNAAVRDLAQLMQLGLRHDGAGWHLEPAR